MVFTAQYCVSCLIKCINKSNHLIRKQQLFVRDYCANKLQAPILVWLLSHLVPTRSKTITIHCCPQINVKAKICQFLQH